MRIKRRIAVSLLCLLAAAALAVPAFAHGGGHHGGHHGRNAVQPAAAAV